ncbi:hypothetical protein SKC37_03490 [Aquirufa sp. HETE-83D]|uniref:Uncharacterized protein n=1 Tax=Aquirufa esocilacus TaxID=3096513 RepID=A0ABW6DIZ8_9BACT
MAKLFKFFLFVLLLGFLAYIFVYISELDNTPENTEVTDMDVVKAYGDSLALIAVDDTISKPATSSLSSAFEDFTVSVESGVIHIEKSHAVLLDNKIADFKASTVLATDLNGNAAPEFWVAGYQGKNYRILAFEYEYGKLKSIRFPAIMGRQRLGYSGYDSLYLEKAAIVHSFDFENDPYSDLGVGIRLCYYKYGVDGSFVLSKTLDLEKEDE